jgi:hypothetical protein
VDLGEEATLNERDKIKVIVSPSIYPSPASTPPASNSEVCMQLHRIGVVYNWAAKVAS